MGVTLDSAGENLPPDRAINKLIDPAQEEAGQAQLLMGEYDFLIQTPSFELYDTDIEDVLGGVTDGIG